MSSYYLPDITGQNSDYKQANVPFNIYQAGIKIRFENSPIFISSLKIALTDGTTTLLVRDVDYRVNADDIDETAMSRAFLENPQFSGTLVRSVTIISTLGVGKVVALSFQEFYLTTPGRTFDDGTPFEVSPDLIKNLMIGLAETRQQIARVASPNSFSDAPPKLLPFDINAELSSNVVTGEPISVNTLTGAKIIRLEQGAYFASTLTLSYNGANLSKDTDYLPINLSTLTQQTTNVGGIYQHILLVGNIVGTVTASYHAVGGDVQRSDVSATYDLMVAIKNFLDNETFVTNETIIETSAFRAFNARLSLMENNMRSLLTGSPTYGDSTAGASVIRPISAPDANFHWWTIANLYQVQGSTDIITADRFKGRVYFPGSKVSVTFTADVNLNQSRQPVSFKTESVVFDPKYTLFTDLSVSAPVYPLVRVVWNQVSQTFSGASLQIGIPLPSLSDQMIVEDLSTTESCWILDKTGQFVSGGQTVTPSAPKDNGFTLPDGHSTWSAVSSSSFSKVHVPSYDKGYLVYSGSVVPLSQLNTTNSTANKFNVVLPSYFPINQVKIIVVTLASPDGSQVYDVEVSIPNFQVGVASGKTTFADNNNDVIGITTTLLQDTAGVVTLSINISDITFNTLVLSNNTPPYTPMTDLVRYVRVKA